MSIHESRRSGFTLVELMVAMALTMFVMLILSQAFVTSLDTFSGLKAIGDMQANLRSASMLIQADLTANHFEGRRELHDPDLTLIPPRQGFFAIYQGSASINEGIELGFNPPTTSNPADLQSYRATNHILYFTVKQTGNRPENVYSANVPLNSPLLSSSTNFGNYFAQPGEAMYQPGPPLQPNPTQFNSQWAEVCYFLVPTGQTDVQTSTPLFALWRAQYLLVPNPVQINQAAVASTNLHLYPNLSCFKPAAGTSLKFNAPEDVTALANRTLIVNAAASPSVAKQNLTQPHFPPLGCTQVLNNVVSFQVQVFTQFPGFGPGPEFTDVAGGAFDSSTSNYNVVAVKITLRIWDSASKQSRQVTIVQDM